MTTNHKWGEQQADGTQRADGTILTWWWACRRCGAVKGGRRCQCGGEGTLHIHRFAEPGEDDCHDRQA